MTSIPQQRLRLGALPTRRFYATVFLLTLFIAFSFVSSLIRPPSRDDVRPKLRSQGAAPSCKDLHLAQDQCAFVETFCQDDIVGLLPYLRTYYCSPHAARPFIFVAYVLWLGTLFTTIGLAASDFLSINLSTIATVLGISESLAGVTFLAFGNGSPDVFSTFAAMGSNSTAMAVGELVGAASFITAVVVGSMALVNEFKVSTKTYMRDLVFFIVAVCFTLRFLADGYLHFWECWSMVGYYLLYVLTVVFWEWFVKRRKQQRLIRSGAGATEDPSHHHILDQLLESGFEPYRDDPAASSPHHTDLRRIPHHSPHDSSASQAGPRIEIEGISPPIGPEPDAECAEEDPREDPRQIATEVASSMRVLRPRGPRRATLTPIRPSLVGALEFRSSLAMLQRENKQSLPSGRRFSVATMPGNDNIPLRGQDEEERAGSSMTRSAVPAIFQDIKGRIRALSSGATPKSTPPAEPIFHTPSFAPVAGAHPTLSPHDTPEQPSLRVPSPVPSYQIDGNLAPPPTDFAGGLQEVPRADTSDRQLLPDLQLYIPSRRSSTSSRSAHISPFPGFTETPQVMTPHPDTDHSDFTFSLTVPVSTVQMPDTPPMSSGTQGYSFFTTPATIFSTLFPTLQGWGSKTAWDKVVSILSLPSILLLVITLPVAEPDLPESTVDDGDALGVESGVRLVETAGGLIPSVARETEWQRYRRYSIAHSRRSSQYSVSPFLEPHQEEQGEAPGDGSHVRGPPQSPTKPTPGANDCCDADDMCWNRWLVCLQLICGPQFVGFVVWANIQEDLEAAGTMLAKMAVCILIASLVLVTIIMACTGPYKKPRYAFLFCFPGFLVSIAWIATIAGEVVSLLKTFGIVLDISEALLGLTVFAAGNSIGDLVADVTMARLGFPVMALSACFGGPMLNILIGIGLGGVMVMVRSANKRHHDHPDKPIAYKPYKVHLPGTLLLSATTLLITLTVLLIAVPRNKWKLGRGLGWGLITLWTISTTLNVILEMTGTWNRLFGGEAQTHD